MNKSPIERAFEEYAAAPMPKLNQNHIFDRSKHELENNAIRRQIAWISRKYGITFKELDDYIEEQSKGIV